MRLLECNLQLGHPIVAFNECRQPHGAAKTNLERVDVESWKMESEGITGKLTGEKGNPDFVEQLKELNAEISSKADTRCNMEKFLKARELESEVEESASQMEESGCKAALGYNMEKLLKAREMVSEEKVSDNKKEEREGEDFMYGLGSGPLCSGLYGVLGRTEANSGLAEIKNAHAQVMEPQAFHVGLKTSGVAKLGNNKKTKSPIRKKSHTCN